MSQTKHTPGSWMVGFNDGSGPEYIVESETQVPVATVWEKGIPGEQMTETETMNAKLIAAAPDLLENLEAILLHLKHFVKNHDYIPIVNAEAAIAKAKGETI